MAGKATANKSCHEEQEQRQSHDADSADGGPDVALKAVLRIQRGRHALPNVRDRLDFVDHQASPPGHTAEQSCRHTRQTTRMPKTSAKLGDNAERGVASAI